MPPDISQSHRRTPEQLLGERQHGEADSDDKKRQWEARTLLSNTFSTERLLPAPIT